MRLGLKSKKILIFYTLFFAVFLFAYMVIQSVTDNYFVEYAPQADVTLLHYLPTFIRALGFLSFPLLRLTISGERGRKLTLVGIDLLLFVSALLILPEGHSMLRLGMIFMLTFSIGHIGGLIYYILASVFADSRFRGRCIGIASSIAVAAQYLFSGKMGLVGNLFTIILLFLILSVLSLKPPTDYILENPLPYAEDSKLWAQSVKEQLVIAAAVTLLICMIMIQIDVFFVGLSFSGSIDLNAFPRLFMIPGYLIFGFCADFRKKNLLPTITLGTVSLSMMLVLIPFFESYAVFFLCIYYILAALNVFLFTYAFTGLAPRTVHAEFFGGFGRVLSDIVSVFFYFAAVRLNNRAGALGTPLFYLGFFLPVVVLSVLLTVKCFQPNLRPHTVVTESIDGPNEADNKTDTRALVELLDEYQLTPREKDVALLLTDTELPMKTIAAQINISERTLYRYSKHIYEKTGTETRAGLVKLLFGERIVSESPADNRSAQQDGENR